MQQLPPPTCSKGRAGAAGFVCGCLWLFLGVSESLWVDPPKPCTTTPAVKELFPSRGDPCTESASHTLYTDRKEGLKEETEQELLLLTGKRQRLSPIIQMWWSPEPPTPQPSGCCLPKASQGENPLIQEDVQEIRTPGEGLSWPIYLGGLIPICGVGRLGIPSHWREKLCSTDVTNFISSLLCISAEPRGLRCCKPAKIMVLFQST